MKNITGEQQKRNQTKHYIIQFIDNTPMILRREEPTFKEKSEECSHAS